MECEMRLVIPVAIHDNENLMAMFYCNTPSSSSLRFVSIFNVCIISNSNIIVNMNANRPWKKREKAINSMKLLSFISIVMCIIPLLFSPPIYFCRFCERVRARALTLCPRISATQAVINNSSMIYNRHENNTLSIHHRTPISICAHTQ